MISDHFRVTEGMSAVIFCIDSGNTRLKWGLHDGSSWRAQGALAQNEIARLAELAGQWPVPQKIMVANVAGDAVAHAIVAALAAWKVEPCFVRSEARRAGVSNGYTNPAQLGVDRWCALIGARRQTQAPVVVVGAGTATTIDTLDENGHFLGGFILPGFDLMRAALAKNTANLPWADGEWQAYPRCTDDAIASGCIEAQAGAIERAFERIAGHPGATCLLSGGAAEMLENRLRCPHRRSDHLVLEGLRTLAVER